MSYRMTEYEQIADETAVGKIVLITSPDSKWKGSLGKVVSEREVSKYKVTGGSWIFEKDLQHSGFFVFLCQKCR
jgi:hypothetical protein